VAYAWNKNTSARPCAKNAGGEVFVGHYGATILILIEHKQNAYLLSYNP